MKINAEPEYEVKKQKLRKTQKEWIPYFNEKGMKMISAPDIYKAIKEGTNKALLDSLKEDFSDSWEVTSTRINYKENLVADIIHDFESKVVEPKTYKDIKIPNYSGNFEPNKEAEVYLQALFDTKDDITTILKTLKSIRGDKEVRLWTPSISDRKLRAERAVGLCFYGFDWFCVNGYGWIDDSYGYSRGVLSDSAKRSKTKEAQ